MSEARELDHGYVGTEHLLLGLHPRRKGNRGAGPHRRGRQPRRRARRSAAHRGRAFATVARTLAPARPTNARMAPLRDHARGSRTARIVTRRIRDLLNARGARPGVADLLEALVFSSRQMAAAFASREIEMQGLLAEIRELRKTTADEQAPR